MKWNNVQFGEFEYSPEHILQFNDGLIGFEEYKKFILIDDEDSEPFVWLVSLENPELSFPLIDPSNVLANNSYEVDANGKTVLAIVSLRKTLEQSTVNLRSPIVIENETQAGKQIVLENPAYQFQQPLFTTLPLQMKG